jgi:hypothetical protein
MTSFHYLLVLCNNQNISYDKNENDYLPVLFVVRGAAIKKIKQKCL